MDSPELRPGFGFIVDAREQLGRLAELKFGSASTNIIISRDGYTGVWPSDREALERAAAGWGIELEYTDTWGRTHTASDETLRGVLGALGINTLSDQDLAAAALARDLERWSRAFDPPWSCSKTPMRSPCAFPPSARADR